MIPKYIETYDIQTHLTSTHKFIKRVNDRLLLYENIKTGCKQCFDIRDIAEIKSQKVKKLTKYEWNDTMYLNKNKEKREDIE